MTRGRPCCNTIITRVLKLLIRRGAVVDGRGSTYMADNDADSDGARAQAAAGRGM